MGCRNLGSQLLIHILKALSTPLLLRLAPTCHRLYHLILRIIHGRLLLAASPRDHDLILECYHPSLERTEPHLVCEYLGTPGLNNPLGTSQPTSNQFTEPGFLAQLGNIYSTFRPVRQEAEEKFVRPHPAGGALGSQNGSAAIPSQGMSVKDNRKTSVSHNVSLDSNESFSQLCVKAHLVQLGPRRGIFSNLINVTEGVIRIWRDWLAQRATTSVFERAEDSSRLSDPVDSRVTNEHMLWVDDKKNAGIDVYIKENRWRREVPVLLHRDEDPAVSYVMEYKGGRICSID